MIVNVKNGVSSYEIARALGVTQKTAWLMDHRIRAAMKHGGFDNLDDSVEADENYTDGKTSEERGRFNNKSAVIGVVEKKKNIGQIRAFATKHADATVTLAFLRAQLNKVQHYTRTKVVNITELSLSSYMSQLITMTVNTLEVQFQPRP